MSIERQPWAGGIIARKPGEGDAAVIQRMLVSAIFFDAPDAEIAAACEVAVETVVRVRKDFERSVKVRQMIAHANAVRERTGFNGAPSELVTLALEKYAQHQALLAALDLASEQGATTPAARPKERQSAPVPARESTNERAAHRALNGGGAPRARGDSGREAGGLPKVTGNGQTGIPGVR